MHEWKDSIGLIPSGAPKSTLCHRACLPLRQGSWAFWTPEPVHHWPLAKGKGRRACGHGGCKIPRHRWLSTWADPASNTWSQMPAVGCRDLTGGGAQSWQDRPEGTWVVHWQRQPQGCPPDPAGLLWPPGTSYGSSITFCCKRKRIMSLESPGVGFSSSRDWLPSPSG